MIFQIELWIQFSAQPSNRRANLPSLPRVVSNGADMSSNTNSTRLQSAGENLRRVSSTGKFNQSNTASTTPSSTQRQNSNVNKFDLTLEAEEEKKAEFSLATIDKFIRRNEFIIHESVFG